MAIERRTPQKVRTVKNDGSKIPSLPLSRGIKKSAAKGTDCDNTSPLSVVDLFCGAGGLSEGFRQAGFLVAAGSDNEPWLQFRRC